MEYKVGAYVRLSREDETKTITRNDILQLIDKIEIGNQGERLKIYFKVSI